MIRVFAGWYEGKESEENAERGDNGQRCAKVRVRTG